MGLSELKKKVDLLADEEQRKLLAYLSHQRNLKDAAHIEKLTSILDDKSPERWVSFDSVREDPPES